MRGRALASLSLLLAVVALAASDWPTGKAADFWTLHPLFAGVVSGGMVLAIGYLLVDRWLARIAAERWRIAQGITFKALGRAADELSLGLEELLGGAPDPWQRHTANGPAGAACAERAVEYDNELSGIRPVDHVRRLDVLLADSRWVTAAVDAIDGLKHAHRRQIARWAPVLVTTDNLASILDESAQLNERVFELQAPLRRLRDVPATGDDLASDARIREAKCAWQEVLFEAVLLQERLMRAAVDPAWQHTAGRRRLTGEQVLRLEATHAERGPIKRPRGIPRPSRADVARGIA